jgi:hypothetical protein
MRVHERATDDVAIKSFCSFEIKDAEKGEVEAIIATLGVVDKDEDIIRPGAVADGSKVSMSSYGHDAVWGARPVGKGTLHTVGNKLVFKGKMFLATTDGRDTFECLKEMGADQEWSFGFRILGAEVPSDDERKDGARRILTKLDAFEVSPVIIGAGVDTRTTAVKGAPPAPTPPDPAIEAARIAAEQADAAERERVATVAKTHALNEDADRRFRRPPAGVGRR